MILLLNKVQFEYDIRGLITSFFTGVTVVTKSEGNDYSPLEEKLAAMTEILFAGDAIVSEAVRPVTFTADLKGAELPIISVYYGEDKTSVLALCEGGRVFASSALADSAEGMDKNALKRMVYKIFGEMTGDHEKPWGTLTGIRPIKLPMAMIEEGYDDAEISAHFALYCGFDILVRCKVVHNHGYLFFIINTVKAEFVKFSNCNG